MLSRSVARHPAVPILCAIPFVGLATGGLFPLIALHLDTHGISDAFIGVITSTHYAGSFLGALTYGLVASRIGIRPAFTLAGTGLALTSLALYPASDQAQWLILRFIGGYALGGAYVLSDAWITSAGSRSSRGKLFGIYEMLRLGAVATGPALLLSGDVMIAFAAIAVSYLAAIAPVLLAVRPTFATEAAALRGIKHSLYILPCFWRPLLILACGGACNASFYGLGAIYAERAGMPIAAIAGFVSAVLLAPILLELIVGAVSDRVSRMVTAALVSGLAFAAAILMAVMVPAEPALAIAGGVLVGIGTVPLYALAISRMVDVSGSEAALAIAGASMVAYNLGGGIGPALAGVLMSRFDAAGLYWAIALFVGIACGLALFDRYGRGLCCPEIGVAQKAASAG